MQCRSLLDGGSLNYGAVGNHSEVVIRNCLPKSSRVTFEVSLNHSGTGVPSGNRSRSVTPEHRVNEITVIDRASKKVFVNMVRFCIFRIINKPPAIL